ncbi:tripartite motif-containing protein 56 [Plakobranchus ocellatus]|uniref:Tripartite motif-containing protein 56 n=1 Tax=Plakobranchus ocellatus TaxID=259542 RepID=A0AAV3YPZ6_9GAST|nr:tripartite motif-containing protein 56 [Plakobranchus ocellatus]
MDSEKVERLRERLLQCSVCMDEYKDPRILPCHHTFCCSCIESVVQSSSSTGRIFRCPHCRSDVCVPNGGIKDLPINFYIISLQDELGSLGYSGKCDVCKRDWLVAQFRCIDCDLDICRFCIHAHRLETHTEPPKILRVESQRNTNQYTSCHICAEHPDETQQLFCTTCKQAICIRCSCSGHKQHSVIPLSVKLQESQVYLQKKLDKLTSEKRKVSKAGKDLERARANVEELCDRCMLAVDAEAHRACETIMNKKSQIVKEILLSEKKQLSDIDNALKDFKAYVQRIERGMAFLSDLQDSDICLEVVDTFKIFSQKLKTSRNDFVSNHIKIQEHQFLPSNWSHMFSVNFGHSRKFFHFGTLGALSVKNLCLSIDPKKLDIVLKPRVIIRVLKSSMFKKILQFFAVFLFCQLLFYISDVTGMFDTIALVSQDTYGRMVALPLDFSRFLNHTLQEISKEL